MPDPTTTRLGIPYVQGTDTINAYPGTMQTSMTVIDAVYGREFGDFLVPGVVGNASFVNNTGPTINSSTGVLTVTLNSDIAWVMVSGTLTRCALPTGATNLTPTTLPTSGNFICVGIYVAPPALWSTLGSLSQACGLSQSSAANALASPPSTPAGTLLLEYVVVGNSSGTYSIASTTDERFYARNDSGWLAISGFANSWVSNSGPALAGTAAGYRLIGSVLHLQGVIISGTTGNCFLLPTGYQPITPVILNVATGSGNAGTQLTISAAGQASMNVAFSTVGNVHLDGLQFLVN